MRGSLDPARSGLRAYAWCVSYITVGELAKGAEMHGGTSVAGPIWPTGSAMSSSSRSTYGSPTSGDGSPAQRSSAVAPARPVNDMWIAAVALSNDIPVATRNVKDYSDFVELHGLDLVNPQS
jgi:hypothetical protein